MGDPEMASNQWIRDQELNPSNQRSEPSSSPPTQALPSPEHQVGFFSTLTFQWITSLLRVGMRRPLQVNDIWELESGSPRRVPAMKARLLTAIEARRRQPGRYPVIAMALHDTFAREFDIAGVLQLFAACLAILCPFTIRFLIEFVAKAWEARHDHGDKPPLEEGIGLVLGLSIMLLCQSLSLNHAKYRTMMVGAQARSVLTSVIFDKAIRLSGRAKAGGKSGASAAELPADVAPGSEEEKEHYKKQLESTAAATAAEDHTGWSNGKIVNLMSTDTARLEQVMGGFHLVWTTPVQILLALALLCVNVQYSAVVGFAFLCATMPMLGFATKSLVVRRKAVNIITDQRLGLLQEIFTAVRFLKFSAWETSFLGRVNSIRNLEMKGTRSILSTINSFTAGSYVTPIIASMLTFATYSASHPTPSPAAIFSSLALFNALRIPLNTAAPLIGFFATANQSLVRIQEFLDAEEIENSAIYVPDAAYSINVQDASFTWERTSARTEPSSEGPSQVPDKQVVQEESTDISEDEEGRRSASDDRGPFCLEHISLTLRRGELVAVIGSVGSGKSSLLAALAGEMRLANGHVFVGDNRTAYCQQVAWMQNATIRENITFGRDFDPMLYERVIEACALRMDFEALPFGDLTEIGEKGITLSGGQKQRLSIARAIYSDAEIVILDDPLSAVDAHVGGHIMNHAICGVLRSKTRLLATHQLHVLSQVDRVIWMREGTIHKIATYPELIENDTDFQELMGSTSMQERTVDQEKTPQSEIKSTGGEESQTVALMQDEERSLKRISWDVWISYFRASGSLLFIFTILGLIIALQCAMLASSIWLSYWTRDDWEISTSITMGVYAAMTIVQVPLVFAIAIAIAKCGMKASKQMHQSAVHRLLGAQISFFDTTPLGRIMNRFSKDVEVMDSGLVISMQMFLLAAAMVIGIYALTVAYYHWFGVVLIVLLVLFLLIARQYRSPARDIKRLEAVLRSVVVSRFSEALGGTTSIRAYQMERKFCERLDTSVDAMDAAYYLTIGSLHWLSIRLDVLGSISVLAIGILVVTSQFDIHPSVSGLVLAYMVTVMQMIPWIVVQFAEVENNMNATERIHHYGTQIEQEERQIAPREATRASWPERGEILFQQVQMRYRAELPLVLLDFTLHIRPGERIGIVGRTGAGKSSILTTLFRLAEYDGRICIDGVDISKIGLHDLRSKLTIIPQDPTLFQGSVRDNLDPYNQHSDDELWRALQQAGLVSSGGQKHAYPVQLDSVVAVDGQNFSLGQRQLVALARALVRNSRIIVCDEATSAVDFETDRQVTETIANLQDRTVLCIAHRLKTIIHYDRVLVMDAGRIAELDTPLNLYDREGGIFRSMCDTSNISRDEFRGSNTTMKNTEVDAITLVEKER
ncbi:putative ABC transporter [Amniculicola lignicola CBS 123094]|uniref:Putative ABC transporter n=1 Tax=Amniculicola lignicola CBS 123094 TaxID=1392246 RepID=A0A6A5WHA3_9PLEO|nr:putative ABC transporter [Amniculicola lignicola CBS 123094]